MFRTVFQNSSLDKTKSQIQAQFPQDRMLGVEGSFKVLTVHNTTQSTAGHCPGLPHESEQLWFMYNTFCLHGQAPTALVGHSLLLQDFSIPHNSTDRILGSLRFSITELTPDLSKPIMVLHSHSLALTHTNQTFILKTWCHKVRKLNVNNSGVFGYLLWSFRLVGMGD